MYNKCVCHIWYQNQTLLFIFYIQLSSKNRGQPLQKKMWVRLPTNQLSQIPYWWECCALSMTLIIFKWWGKKRLLLLSGLNHNTYWFPIQTFISLHRLNLCIQWIKYCYWFPIQTFISLHQLNLCIKGLKYS